MDPKKNPQSKGAAKPAPTTPDKKSPTSPKPADPKGKSPSVRPK
jgi:hypothetical protein